VHPSVFSNDPSYLPDGGSRRSPAWIRRLEEKFQLELELAKGLRQEIAKHLPVYEFRPGFGTTGVATVYFDTFDRKFYRQAERSYDDNLKVRVKEYFYRAEDGRPLTSPDCWVETKERSRGQVLKRRFALAKSDLARCFAGEDVSPLVLRRGGAEALSAYRALQSLLDVSKIVPAAVVQYRRTVYQELEDELRITFDDAISVYPPVGNLYEDHESLLPEVLGTPIRRHDAVILEIKCPSRHYPAWLRDVLGSLAAQRFSKFTTSVRFLREELDGRSVASPAPSPSTSRENRDRPPAS